MARKQPSPEELSTTRRWRWRIGGKIVTTVLVLLCFCLAGSSVYFYRNSKAVGDDASVMHAEIIDKISSVLVLPDEAPTVITVVDRQRLSNQQLAQRVHNGDVVFIFSDANKLVIYRPDIEKVVDILSVQAPSATNGEPAGVP